MRSVVIITRRREPRSAMIAVNGAKTADAAMRSSIRRPTPVAPPPCR